MDNYGIWVSFLGYHFLSAKLADFIIYLSFVKKLELYGREKSDNIWEKFRDGGS